MGLTAKGMKRELRRLGCTWANIAVTRAERGHPSTLKHSCKEHGFSLDKVPKYLLKESKKKKRR